MATPIAHKGVVAGAKVQAATVLDFLMRPELVEQAWTYFRDVQTKDQKYVPFIAKDTPPAIWLNEGILNKGPAVYLAAFGVLSAWYLYIKRPELPAQIAARVSPLYKLLANKFYVDEIYQAVFAGGSRSLGTALWRVGDVALIDGGLVNGSARVVGWLSGVLRHMQSGLLYHYAFAMIIGLSALLAWYVLR
jgi:NADH:ubiquinone oxidoreductase subunit 5 (subunit L)/multisubunit Na+/H+ antiporter MnhA subunit